MIQGDNYLNMTAAAKLSGYTRQWLQKLVSAGTVPGAENIAGHPVFLKAAFAPWAEEQRARKKRRPLTHPK